MSKETKFLTDVKRVLDESVDNLDGATLSRLTQARNEAVDRKRHRSRFLLPFGAISAGLAAAGVIAVLLLQPGPTPQVPDLADISLLGSDEPLEFYEDMEFYQWLLESEEGADVSRSGKGLPDLPVMARTDEHNDAVDGNDARHEDAGLSRNV